MRNTPFASRLSACWRLVERGVPCIHIYYGVGQVWDDHKEISQNLRERCPDMDQAAATFCAI